jgi:hypothetical protein
MVKIAYTNIGEGTRPEHPAVTRTPNARTA